MLCFRYKKKHIYFFITFLLITYSNCLVVQGSKMRDILEYCGYFMMMFGIFSSYAKKQNKYIKNNIIKYFTFFTIFLCMGFLVQDISIKRKIILICIVLIITSAIMSETYINDVKIIKTMTYACFIGVFFSVCSCLICGIPVIMSTSESTFGISLAFNGGIRDKNVATIMLLIIISFYLYKEMGKKLCVIDRIVIFLALIVFIMANSRGAWIEGIIFVLMTNYKKLKKFRQSDRLVVFLILLVFFMISATYVYNNYIISSGTYMYRLRGLTNYLNMFGADTTRMWFGSAELFYDNEVDYVTSVRSITGWNGTLEIAWLNILIKNGLFGIIAYIVVFIRIIVIALRSKIYKYKTLLLSVCMPLLISSFVATYIQDIHGLYGIYSYILMGYIVGLIHRESYNNRNGQLIQ